MNDQMIRTYGSNGRENLTRLAVSAAILTLTACGGGGSSSVSDVDNISDSDLSKVSENAAEAPLDLSNLQSAPLAIGAATDGNLLAATDVAETAAGQTLSVGILANDNMPAGTQLQLVGQPANGRAELLDSGELSYTANSDFEGTDAVEYILVGADGSQSRGMLYIAVACADCLVDEAVVPAAPVELVAHESGHPYCDAATETSGGYGWQDDASCVSPPAIAAALPLPTLSAKADYVTLQAGTTTAVSATRNDTILDRRAITFEIIDGPSNGVVEAADAGVVVYTAPADFKGTDNLSYSLTDGDGNTAYADIEFTVVCDLCDTLEGLRLSWPANPSSQNIDGYKVFFGPDENPHTSTMLTEYSASEFTESAPNAVFHLADDLNVSSKEGGCFTVTAVRDGEESDHSDPVCFTLG